MTDTVVMQERIGQLGQQFKLPTMGAQSVACFTAETVSQAAADRKLRVQSST